MGYILVDYWIIRMPFSQGQSVRGLLFPVGRMILLDKHTLALLLSYVSGWPFALL